MKRFARVRCGNTIYEREIDSRNRMILGHIGNIPSISHKLVKKINNEEDVRKVFRMISVDPVDSVEFIERE